VIGLPPVLNFASDELKARVVPDVLAGKKFICLAISEACVLLVYVWQPALTRAQVRGERRVGPADDRAEDGGRQVLDRERHEEVC
jgi:alkylation response protein AidB-like acyl-CoA dehydrogenase